MARSLVLDAAAAELAARQHGAFTLAQLGDRCSHRAAAERVRRDEWERFERGTFVLAGADDSWRYLAAVCLHLPTAVVTGAPAGRWWRLDGIDDDQAARLTVPAGSVLVPYGCGGRRIELRRCDDLLPWEVRAEPGGCLRFTDPTRTLIELAPVTTADHLERAIESALRRRLTTLPRLRTRTEQLRRQGRIGPTRLLGVLAVRPEGGLADSDGEVLVLQLLRSAGMPAPVRQHTVGRWRFDLAWPELRLAVELDGSHHRDPARLALDDRKQNEAALAGWLVLRFTWDRIAGEPHRVVEEIHAARLARARVLVR